jgi:hypothetical protein
MVVDGRVDIVAQARDWLATARGFLIEEVDGVALQK